MPSERKLLSPSAKERFAILAVHDAEHVFPGIGAYSTSELWDLAGWYLCFLALIDTVLRDSQGLSPFLTVSEVFLCPSRTARLCKAYHEFLRKAIAEMEYKYFCLRSQLLLISFHDRSLLRPCLRDGMLAPMFEINVGLECTGRK